MFLLQAGHLLTLWHVPWHVAGHYYYYWSIGLGGDLVLSCYLYIGNIYVGMQYTHLGILLGTVYLLLLLLPTYLLLLGTYHTISLISRKWLLPVHM